jgi:uncharacterized protein (DUF1499 family)
MDEPINVNPRWTMRLSRWTLRMGIGAILVSVGGTLLARYDIVPKLMGLNFILGGALLAVLGTIFGLIAVLLNARFKAGLMGIALAGLILSGVHFGFMASRAAIASNVPPIHDITTDLANPPAFTKLTLGADNLRGVETLAKWRERHAAAYTNLGPLTLNKSVAAVTAAAEKLAKERGWEIALVDPVAGQIEATASVSMIRFKDDVIIRIKRNAENTRTIVDLRSVSRVGISDLGVNAKRIAEFKDALAKA